MKRFGIVSYNIYCNFTNYGSALQSWALCQAVNRLGSENQKWQAVLVDYCPDVLLDKNPLNPLKHMWDTDEESKMMCMLSLPAIRENAKKFDTFFSSQFCKTKNAYTSANFQNIISDEKIDGFICGSDTIFCIDEFEGFDDGYYANYPCMKNGYSVAYAASFGDSHFTPETYEILNERLQNFKAIGLRENAMIPYVKANTSIPVQQVLDPTLLLTSKDYDTIAAPVQSEKPYLLLYARRYNPQMSAYAERLAAENNWEIIEISLRATNAEHHRMFYEAGVEEFLSLVKHAQFIVTNSFHGMIFSIQYCKNFCIFSREQCDSKITELLDSFGLSHRLMVTGFEKISVDIDYTDIHEKIKTARKHSLDFLKYELELNNE